VSPYDDWSQEQDAMESRRGCLIAIVVTALLAAGIVCAAWAIFKTVTMIDDLPK